MAESTKDLLIKVEAQVDDAAKEIAKLKKEIADLKKETGGAGEEFEKSGNRVGRAGNRMVAAGKKIKETMNTETALAFAAVGGAAEKFAKSCIDSAITSESEWTRFGAMVNSNGGNWKDQEKEIKGWAKTFSNQHGYMVSDTRAASAALLQYGVKADQLGASMNGVAALAARTGSTEEEAANVVISALNGKANALRKATGLEIENYKAADGSIDTQRLLTDIYNQNSDALEKHGETTEAQMNKMQNSFNTLKSEIGQALLPVVQILAGALTTIAQAFSKLPAPVKTVIAVLLVIGGAVGVVVGAIGMLAPVLTNVGGILVGISKAGSVFAFLFQEGSVLATLFPSLAATMSGVTISLTSILWPVLAVIAAFAALYYIGLKMGWWSDLSGMISKFGETLGWVGGQLMGFLQWFSLLFTNFPEAMNQLRAWLDNVGPIVQEALSNLGPILTELAGKIWDDFVQVFTHVDPKMLLAVFFPLPTLIYNILSYIAPYVSQAFSDAYNAASNWLDGIVNQIVTGFNNSINGIATWGMNLYNGVASWLDQTVTRAGQWAMDFFISIGAGLGDAYNQFNSWGTNVVNSIISAFAGIGGQLQAAFMQMVNTIRVRLVQARAIVSMLINQIRTAIVTRVRQIPIQVGIQFMRIVQFIRTRLNQARAIAQTLATRIRQVIVQRIQAVAGQVRNFFGQVVNAIRTTLSNAASSALEKATEIYNNIKNQIMKIPQEVADEFGKIPDKIKNALANAASAALSGAQNIVSSFLSGLGRASPGIIQRESIAEFAETASRIGENDGRAVANAERSARGVVEAYRRNMTQLPVLDLGLNGNALSSNIGAMSQALRSDYGSSRAASMGSVRNTSSVTNDNRSNSKTIVFENVTLDCTNLSTNEARQLFYKAVEGL